MFLFDTLVVGVLLFGVELWGYKERAEVERVQLRYVKWTLGLDGRTPDYLVLEETKRMKLIIITGIRAWKFEEGVKSGGRRSIVKEYIKEKETNREKTKSRKERQEYFRRNGLSQEGVQERR